jgi:O-antigen ligase
VSLAENYIVEERSAVRRWPLFVLALLIAVGALALLALGSRKGLLMVGGLGAIGVIAWGVRQTIIDPLWLIFALVLEETVPYLNLLPFNPDSRWWIRYPILFALCLPALPAVLRSGLINRGNFRRFLIYFGWAAISICFSLYPAISVGRLLPTIMLFGVLSLIAARVRDAADVQRVLWRFLLASGVLVGMMLLAAFVWPKHVFIEGDDPKIGVYNWVQDQAGILRFTGFWITPNEIGALMLGTMTAGLAHWGFSSGWRRWLLGAIMAGSVVIGMMADSRSNFIALAIGAACFSIWKYRSRGALACLAAAILAGAVYVSLGKADLTYLNRDVTTLTGRTDAWRFEMYKISQRPLTGYGYDVEGAIFQDPKFPDWNIFWAKGPNTSLHDGYLTVAVGLGLPALLFWLYIFLSPWVSLFRSGRDPLNLKPLFFLIVIPMLVLGLDESGVAEPRYIKGLLMFTCWMLAERQQIALRVAKAINRHAPIRTAAGIDYQRLLSGAAIIIAFVGGLALLAAARPALAADYYADSVAGNDANPGTSTAQPWRSLGHINHFRFRPGDVVHLKRGSVFRETLKPQGRDDANFRDISFVAYGSGGPPPTINGSDVISGWSSAGGQIFRAIESKRVYNVFVDGGPGWGLSHACCLPNEQCRPSPIRHPVRGETCEIGPMRPGSWFLSRRFGGRHLYVWLSGGANPAAHTIEAVTRPLGFHGYASGHQLDGLVFDGLAIVQTGLRGISLESGDKAGCCGSRGAGPGSGFRSVVLRNLTIERTGTGRFDDGSYGNAITIINATAPVVERNIVSYAGNHGNCINVQNSNGARIIGNKVDHWFHNGIDIKGSRDVLVSNNVALDQPSRGAGFYTEFSQNVIFQDDHTSNVSNGFQISDNASASIIDCDIRHAGTCVYFGPHAAGALLRGNSAAFCGGPIEGEALAKVRQQNNKWPAF